MHYIPWQTKICEGPILKSWPVSKFRTNISDSQNQKFDNPLSNRNFGWDFEWLLDSNSNSNWNCKCGCLPRLYCDLVSLRLCLNGWPRVCVSCRQILMGLGSKFWINLYIFRQDSGTFSASILSNLASRLAQSKFYRQRWSKRSAAVQIWPDNLYLAFSHTSGIYLLWVLSYQGKVNYRSDVLDYSDSDLLQYSEDNLKYSLTR